jgi:hypothetical protein
MNAALFKQLLCEEESATLDFKQAQYAFAKASDDEKSELLKDILGFANAWRRTEAYILIGVKEVRGGCSNVVGIPGEVHLDDHALQQFVNTKTNRPVQFHYEAFDFNGKQVGILRFDACQSRPVYLKSGFGKLKQSTVYVRRGSSTDPTKPASPDEIAQMGQDIRTKDAQLLVELADVNCDESLGTHLSSDAEFCEMPPTESIPEYCNRTVRGPMGIKIPDMVDLREPRNSQYYREFAHYEVWQRLLRPIRLVVKNTGDVAASSVRIELAVSGEEGARLFSASDFPEPPERRLSYDRNPAIKRIRTVFNRQPGDVSIRSDDQKTQLHTDFDDLQPGRMLFSERFFVAKRTSGDIEIRGRLFADNLPEPQDVSLRITLSVSETSMTLDELLQLADRESDD